MTRIAWGAAGSRTFETGVDRGVLYVGSSNGVPWNGLISVSESKIGGGSSPVYVDGEKKNNSALPEEFAATIEAYSYPELFTQCDGLNSLGGGLYLDDQPRVPFNLTYRTLIGSDLLEAGRLGYKIHLVYQALASPPGKSYKTRGATPEATVFSWPITATPVKVLNRRSTAHFVVDSTRSTPAKLAVLENFLYGTASVNPRFPTVSQLLSMMQ